MKNLELKWKRSNELEKQFSYVLWGVIHLVIKKKREKILGKLIEFHFIILFLYFLIHKLPILFWDLYFLFGLIFFK